MAFCAGAAASSAALHDRQHSYNLLIPRSPAFTAKPQRLRPIATRRVYANPQIVERKTERQPGVVAGRR
jgi:hypothetical protein